MNVSQRLRDAAVNEVRGVADEEERALLSVDVHEWRNALQSVVDDIETQLLLRNKTYIEDCKLALDSDEERELKEQYDTWRRNARTFLRHVSNRLVAVERMCDDRTESINHILDLCRELAERDANELDVDETIDRIIDAIRAHDKRL